MTKYLTVAQYKRYGDGVALGDLSDMSLAMTINRSEAAVDAYMGFDAKRGGFEPHNVLIQQAFDELTRKFMYPNYPVPIRQVKRYRIQVSNLSSAGAGFFATINPNDCVINNDGYYIEIVPLQSLLYSLTPVFVNLGLKPPIVEVDLELGYYIPIMGEIMMDSGNHQTYYAGSGFWATSYTQSNALQPNALPPIPPVVYVNGSTVAANTYTYDPVDGSVTFTSVQSPIARVSIDYTQTIPDYVTEATMLQTTHLIAQRNLNKMGMYDNLYNMRSGEQSISYPRSINVSEQGRSQLSSLCYQAAAILTRYEPVGVV